MDPTSVWHQNFQTEIAEKCYGELDLTSVIARPEGKCDLWLHCSFLYKSSNSHLLTYIFYLFIRN